MTFPDGHDSKTRRPEGLAQYWTELASHSDDPVQGACVICIRTACPRYRNAQAKLIDAGELAGPAVW